jgi:phosphate uptake regulator
MRHRTVRGSYDHFEATRIGRDATRLAAIDLTMAARCYERYADLAVAVAHHGALLALGTPRS